jgi:hypothetical protein
LGIFHRADVESHQAASTQDPDTKYAHTLGIPHVEAQQYTPLDSRKVNVHGIFIGSSIKTLSRRRCKTERFLHTILGQKSPEGHLTTNKPFQKRQACPRLPKSSIYDMGVGQPRNLPSHHVCQLKKLLIQPALLTSRKETLTALMWFVLAWRSTHSSLLKSLTLLTG